LNNAAFVDKAPLEIVASERDKLQTQEQSLVVLKEQLQRIREI
jgi:valyl-tRNA synthetase